MTKISRVGIDWTLGSEAFKSLIFTGLSVAMFVLIARDRKAVHDIRVTHDSLRVLRISTSGRTVGGWTTNQLRSIKPVLRPRMASGRRRLICC